MVALADFSPQRYIIARTFFPPSGCPSQVTGDTSECMLYLCTERTPQNENQPLARMQFSRQLK